MSLKYYHILYNEITYSFIRKGFLFYVKFSDIATIERGAHDNVPDRHLPY